MRIVHVCPVSGDSASLLNSVVRVHFVYPYVCVCSYTAGSEEILLNLTVLVRFVRLSLIVVAVHLLSEDANRQLFALTTHYDIIRIRQLSETRGN